VNEEVPGNAHQSWADFSIVPAVEIKPTLRIISPNGGEELQAGETYTITWESRNVKTVRIEISRDGGQSWTEIASGVNASDQQFEWTPSKPFSGKCRIRITDESDPGISYTSYADFAIVPPPFIRVVSPDGGEVWQAGSTQTIGWNFYGIDKFVIEYTIQRPDVADAWVYIAEVDVTVGATSGSYDWLVPEIESDKCLVRVSDASGSGIRDRSNNPFSIVTAARVIELKFPVGGEVLKAGETVKITWKAQGVKSFDMAYSTDGGESWAGIEFGYIPANYVSADQSFTYDWEVPDTPSTECLVRVSDSDNPGTFDQSAENFTIESALPERTVSVVYPNGGETFAAGDTVTVQWVSQGIENVHIWYTPDSGIHWEDIAAGVPASEGAFSWVIPGGLEGNIFYVSVGDEADNNFYDVSDGAFTITPGAAGGTMEVRRPRGGENWTVGTAEDIEWYAPERVKNVRIEYSNDEGKTWNTIVERITSSPSSYTWTIPPEAESVPGKCIIRVLNADDETEFAVSNAVRIWPDPSNTDAVIAIDTDFAVEGIQHPDVKDVDNGQLIGFAVYGRNWSSSKEYTISLTWDTAYAVLLPGNSLTRMDGEQLTVNGGTFSLPVVDNILQFNRGAYDFTVVRNEEGRFEAMAVRTSIGASWKKEGLLYLPVFKTTTEFRNIEEFKVQVDVRVTDKLGRETNLTPKYFTAIPLQAEPFIRVTFPADGMQLTAGMQQDITWESNRVSSVRIEYSTDGGSTRHGARSPRAPTRVPEDTRGRFRTRGRRTAR